MIENHLFNKVTIDLFKKYLDDPNIKEIAINPDGKLWVENVANEWIFIKKFKKNDMSSSGSVGSFVSLAGNFHNKQVSEIDPFLSGTLPTGERLQIVHSPACYSYVIDIRKNSKANIPYTKYKEEGFFDSINPIGQISEKEQYLIDLYKSRNYCSFIEQAIAMGKNVLICGETGSGKTTFMKSLFEFIPKGNRLISIEDTQELDYFHHENYVQLFYDSQYKEDAIITPSKLLHSCLRLKPTRIMLAEIRDKVALDFIKVIASGHDGTLASAHTPGVEMTFEKLLTNIMENPSSKGLSDNTVYKMLGLTIDVVMHMSALEGTRHITEIYYKGVDYEKFFKS